MNTKNLLHSKWTKLSTKDETQELLVTHCEVVAWNRETRMALLMPIRNRDQKFEEPLSELSNQARYRAGWIALADL